jgi:hypothetical protein
VQDSPRAPRTLLRAIVFALAAALGVGGLVGVATPASADDSVVLTVVNGTVGVSQTVSAKVSTTQIGIPSGVVNFTAAGEAIGSQRVGGTLGDTAEVSWIPVAAGSIPVAAAFVPDGGTQVQDAKDVSITKVDTTTVTSTPGTATTSTEISLIATVRATQGQYVPTGNVTFYVTGGSALGTVRLSSKGIATLEYTTPAKVGTITVYAVYAGDSSSNTSRSSEDAIKITAKSSTVSLIVPQTNYVNTGVTLTAKVDPSTATGTVEFFVSNRSIGKATVAKGFAVRAWVPTATGTFTLTAKYSGGSGVDPGTATNKVTVSPQLKTDQITVDPVGSAGIWVPGSTITLSNGARVRLDVSSASRLKVSLRVTGPCSLDALTLQINGVGAPCTLTASTAGGNGYAPVAQAYQVLPAPGAQTARILAPSSGYYKRGAKLKLSRMASTTNIGNQVTWRVTKGSVTKKGKKRCTIYTTKKNFKVKLKKRGKCRVIGTAPAVPGQWDRFVVKRTYRIR